MIAMKILYAFDSDEHFRFRARGSRRPSRTLYAPDDTIEGEATLRDNVVEILSLTIHRSNGITANTLRAIPLVELREQIARDLFERPDLPREARVTSPTAEPLIAADVLPLRARREGRKTLEMALYELRRQTPHRGAADDFYRLVATAYLAALEVNPGQPIKELLAGLRRSKLHSELSENTLSSWVRKARSDQHRWLSPAQHGRSGAMPTPRLIEWLHNKEGGTE